MKNNIIYYHWGKQCPFIDKDLQLLKEFSKREDVMVETVDLNCNRDIAREKSIFFPQLLVVNDSRYPAPVKSIDFLERFLERPPAPQSYQIQQGEKIIPGKVRPLSPENLNKTYLYCGFDRSEESCAGKKKWWENLQKTWDISDWGLIFEDEKGRVKGGVEFYPSLLVPYPIPRDEQTAFLACIYPTTPDYDVKTPLLKEVFKRLKEKGYNRILMVSGEKGVFPNGPLDYFIKMGFVDLGIISQEPAFQATLHLLEREF